MQKVKTRVEISKQTFLTKTDIQKLLCVSSNRARVIYDHARKKDDMELEYVIEPTKVRITSVAKIVGIPLNVIQKQARTDEN